MSNVGQESNDKMFLIGQINVHTSCNYFKWFHEERAIHRVPPKPALPQSLLSWHGDLIKIECAGLFICFVRAVTIRSKSSDSFALMMLAAQTRSAQVRMS